jgi:hypothetical protein
MTYHPMTIPASQVRTGHTVVLANKRELADGLATAQQPDPA